MRICKLLPLIVMFSLALTGCSGDLSLENQAYILVLGVDTDETGFIELTIQIPKLGSSGNSDENGSKDPSYLVISAKGSSYQQALEKLKWSATRELNLSQIKMIIFSEEVSKSQRFAPIVSTIAETYHLYTASRFVICRGKAGDFIKGHETVLGTSLSEELDAMFDHYSRLGYIPDANFAEVYYAMNSIYSDPVCIWGFSSSESESEDTQAAAMLGTDSHQIYNTKTPSSRHYLGSVVIRNGTFAEKLNADHTLLVNLLTGSLEAFNYECNGQVYQLTPLEKPRVRISLNRDTAEIDIRVRLSAIAQDSSLERNDVGPVIRNDIISTIEYCQSRGIEPFGFANKAATKFSTIDQWQSFDWHKCFSDAKIEVNVEVLRADS